MNLQYEKDELHQVHFNKLLIKPQKGFTTFFTVYIKGHWLRSWYGIETSGPSEEKALEKFIKSYYGTTYTIINKETHPQHYV